MFAQELGFLSKNLQVSNTVDGVDVPEVDVVRALNVLNYSAYLNDADVFLGCAAVNLLNAFVKQPNSKLSYEFRHHLERILMAIDKLQQHYDIHVAFDDEFGKGILILQIDGFQFSYKKERKTELVTRLIGNDNLKWDGIRKQLHATSIFDFALYNDFISNKTVLGNELTSLVENEVEEFENKHYRFVNGNLIKTQSVIKGETDSDKKLKNYFRTKLCEPGTDLVIFVGTFKMIHQKHVTFTTIRPYIKGVNTLTVCNHINIKRSDIESVMQITDLKRNNKYFIIGKCQNYNATSDRMGVLIAKDLEHCPILPMSDILSISKNTFERCYHFSLEEYTARNQKHLKL